MIKKSIACFFSLLFFSWGAMAATLPYGVQNDIALNTVLNTWGWTITYRGDYNATVPISTLFAGTGEYVMLAAIQDGYSTIEVLAAALKSEVMTYTALNVTHTSNGVNWYYNGGSLGFAGAGDTITQGSADTTGQSERDRLSWHTSGGYSFAPTQINGGWRAGSYTSLNSATNWDRLVLTMSVAAPAISANNIDFGNVRVGTTSTSSNLTVTNTGTGTLTGNIYPASGEFSPQSGTQNFSLTSGQSNSRAFTYTPTGRGTDTTNVSITNNAGDITRSLSGTGVSPMFSSSVAANTTIDFGVVEYNDTKTLTLQNLTLDADLGDLTDLTILSATISGVDAACFSLTNFTPGMVLDKNGLWNLMIQFTNIGHTLGNRNATLTIVTDQNAALGQAGATFTWNLSAQAIPEPSSVAIFSIGIAFLGAFLRKK